MGRLSWPAEFFFVALSMLASTLLTASGIQASPSAVKTVSYSTGVNGRQLTWLPVKPAAPDGVTQAAAAETVSPGPTPNRVRRAEGDAFGDPFGDAQGPLQGVPGAKPGSASTEKSAVVPPLGAPPQLLVEPPKASELVPKAGPPAKKPGIEKELQVTIAPRTDECPNPESILLPLTKKDILEAVTPKPGEFPKWCKMGRESFVPRSWAPATFHWTASSLCHRPPYFEDLQLERYGHTVGPWLQSFASGGHFFLSVPALPYAMGLFPPNECVYTLGYYRPGSCTPYLFDALPLSIRGILYEGGVWTGMVFLVP